MWMTPGSGTLTGVVSVPAMTCSGPNAGGQRFLVADAVLQAQRGGDCPFGDGGKFVDGRGGVVALDREQRQVEGRAAARRRQGCPRARRCG